MIIPCEKNRYFSIDVNRMATDEMFFNAPFLVYKVNIIGWFINEKTGLALPVLMNGVKSKLNDIIYDIETDNWTCGHDRGTDYKSMISYIRNEINLRKEN